MATKVPLENADNNVESNLYEELIGANAVINESPNKGGNNALVKGKPPT